MNLSRLAGRITYAVLAGVLSFLIVFILGAIVAHFDVSIGSILEKFSSLIGLLVGIVYFFTRPNPIPPVL